MNTSITIDKSIKVEILLATYNGEIYIEELLDSLISQTYDNWILSVSDDGSNDKSLDIINNFSSKYPEKVRYVSLGKGKGPCENFCKLMEDSVCDLLAFCDQDDVWKSDKLAVMVQRYLDLLNDNNESVPTLIYCDATVVDEQLKGISDSMFKINNIDFKKRELFESLQFENCITGCCLLANKSAVQLAIKEKNTLTINLGVDLVMHDHWLGLLTSYHNGIISYIDRSLILYRQHSNNAIGADGDYFLKNINLKKFKNIIAKYKMLQHFKIHDSLLIYFIKHIMHSLWNK